jgi:hypothetical protein
MNARAAAWAAERLRGIDHGTTSNFQPSTFNAQRVTASRVWDVLICGLCGSA